MGGSQFSILNSQLFLVPVVVVAREVAAEAVSAKLTRVFYVHLKFGVITEGTANTLAHSITPFYFKFHTFQCGCDILFFVFHSCCYYFCDL